MARLDSHPGEVIDRGRRLSFQLDGKTFQAYPGDNHRRCPVSFGCACFFPAVSSITDPEDCSVLPETALTV